jgi:hypothetical protein
MIGIDVFDDDAVTAVSLTKAADDQAAVSHGYGLLRTGSNSPPRAIPNDSIST